MEHIGIDLGGKESQVCVRQPDEKVLGEFRVKTLELSNWLSKRPRSRVVMETCAEAFSIADTVLLSGHDVRVVPTTLVRSLGIGARRTKTDKRDARVLSEVSCRIDIPSVHIRSLRSREWASMYRLRESLVVTRTRFINTVRGYLRTRLVCVRRSSATRFADRVRETLLASQGGLPISVEQVLAALTVADEQIRAADRQITQVVQADPICRRLMSIPGVGPLTSLRFVAVVDDVTRFAGPHAVEAYIGITPGEDSSSERTRRLGITKAGAADMRKLLVQASWVLWMRRPHDPIAMWGKHIAERRGRQIAVVAMARKLAGIMFALWRDDTTYDPQRAAASCKEKKAE